MYRRILIKKEESSTSMLTEIFIFKINSHVGTLLHVFDNLCFAHSSGLSKNVNYRVFGRSLVVHVFPRPVVGPGHTQTPATFKIVKRTIMSRKIHSLLISQKQAIVKKT